MPVESVLTRVIVGEPPLKFHRKTSALLFVSAMAVWRSSASEVKQIFVPSSEMEFIQSSNTIGSG